MRFRKGIDWRGVEGLPGFCELLGAGGIMTYGMATTQKYVYYSIIEVVVGLRSRQGDGLNKLER